MSEGQGRHRMGAKSPQGPRRPQESQESLGPRRPQESQESLGPQSPQSPLPARGPVRPGPGHGARGPSAIRLVWVYPDLLSTYGDRGNLLMLARRARLRGIGIEVAEVNSDQQVPVDGDIYLLGGGAINGIGHKWGKR